MIDDQLVERGRLLGRRRFTGAGGVEAGGLEAPERGGRFFRPGSGFGRLGKVVVDQQTVRHQRFERRHRGRRVRRVRGWYTEAGVEKHQVAAATAKSWRLRLGSDRLAWLAGLPGSAAIAAAFQLRAQLVELLARLVAPGRGPQQLHQHRANVLAARELIRERFDRAERLLELALRVHALEIFEQISLGFDDDVLSGVKPRQMEVRRGAARIDPQDLAAESDRVVEEALIGIEVDRALIVAHCRSGVAHLEVQVSDAVVEGQVRRGVLAGLDLLDGLEIDLDGFAPILLLLELPRAVFELFQTHAASGGKGETGDGT